MKKVLFPLGLLKANGSLGPELSGLVANDPVAVVSKKKIAACLYWTAGIRATFFSIELTPVSYRAKENGISFGELTPLMFHVVPRNGIEPPARGFSVVASRMSVIDRKKIRNEPALLRGHYLFSSGSVPFGVILSIAPGRNSASFALNTSVGMPNFAARF